MKTKPIVEFGKLDSAGLRVLSRRRSEAGFVAKLGMAVGAVVLVAAAAFALIRTKAASTILPGAPAQAAVAATSSAPAADGAQPQVENAVPGAADATPATTAGSAQPSGETPATAKVEKPSGPRTAPAGMVFLTKRVTVTKETGMLSFPKGTLVVVKSKAGGKVKASVRGEVIEVKESDTATVFEE